MRQRLGLLAALAFIVVLTSAAIALGRADTSTPSTETPVLSPAGSSASPAESAAPSPSASGPAATGTGTGTVTLVGAGDIASCGTGADSATAKLVASIPGTVFTVGDNVYDRGTAQEFATCYAETWGAFKGRTRPAVGNHEYLSPGAAGYFDYFGAAAGERGKGWYSYDAGAWHIVVLNSECEFIGGCGVSSPQMRWLELDLAQHPSTCSLAIFHHPRFSSGAEHGSDPAYDGFWRVLYAHGVDVVVNGHDHQYERFGPQTPDGVRDDAKGIREFVVGTGGRSLYRVKAPIANSEVVRNDAYGVLALTLRGDGYDWRFVPAAPSTFSDAGSARCH